MKKSDLTENQLDVLKILADGQWYSRSALRDLTKISLTTIHKVTNRIEQCGLIRVSLLGEPINSYIITDEGRTLLGIVAEAPSEVMTESTLLVSEDFEFMKKIAIDFALKLKGETSLDRISTYSRAVADISSAYCMLSQPMMEFVVDEGCFSKEDSTEFLGNKSDSIRMGNNI